MNISSAEFDLVKHRDGGALLRTSNGVNRNQKTGDDLTAASKSGKRKAYLQEGTRDRPILIDDDPVVPQEWSACGQGSISKKHRIDNMSQDSQGPPQTIHDLADDSARFEMLVRSSQKIIVLSGAGISANAGFPTFQEMRRSKQTSFDHSLYSSSDETIRFHSTICRMLEHLQSDSCQPTLFHKAMDQLVREGRLLRHITQNVDCVEQRLPDLDAKTIRLHGQVYQMRCQKCNSVYGFKPQLFQGTDLPDCQGCIGESQARVSNGKWPLSIGKLKPDVLLDGLPHPDDNEIMKAIDDDLAICPDLVLVVGTKLKKLGAQLAARSFCHAARSRGRVTIWISKEDPASRLRPLFDYILKGDCDAVTQSSHHSSPLVRRPTGCEVAMPSTPSSPNTPRLSLQQLGAYNDILTDTLVDGICYQGVIRKYCDTYYSTSGGQQSVMSILRDVVIKEKDLPRAEHQLLALPSLKRFSDNLKSAAEQDDFRRHMRRYLSLYLPDCAFEISGTNRYAMTTHEATIISWKPIREGEEIKYLCGIRAILTAEEEDGLDRRGHDFSIVVTTRNRASSYLFGPVSWANHDCEANARLISTGRTGMKVIATRDIGISEEIMVNYGEDYFGEDNCECLCKTCEVRCRNGWISEDRTGFHRSPEASLRYQCQHERQETLDDLLATPAGSSDRSTSKCTGGPPRNPQVLATSPNQVCCIRVPGDYLTSGSDVEPVAWAHLDRCLGAAPDGVSAHSCLICERHRKLYGYRWPKTKRKGRYDNEERVYSPIP